MTEEGSGNTITRTFSFPHNVFYFSTPNTNNKATHFAKLILTQKSKYYTFSKFNAVCKLGNIVTVG